MQRIFAGNLNIIPFHASPYGETSNKQEQKPRKHGVTLILNTLVTDVENGTTFHTNKVRV